MTTELFDTIPNTPCPPLQQARQRVERLEAEREQAGLPIDVPVILSRLEAWKRKHGVVAREHTPGAWQAVAKTDFIGDKELVPDLTDDELYDVFEAWLDSHDGHGGTEEDACFEVADKLGFPWLESITLTDRQPAAAQPAREREAGA